MRDEESLPLFGSKRIPDHPHGIPNSYASISSSISRDSPCKITFNYKQPFSSFLSSVLTLIQAIVHVSVRKTDGFIQEHLTPSFALFLSINLLFFALASGCNSCGYSKPTPSLKRSAQIGGLRDVAQRTSQCSDQVTTGHSMLLSTRRPS